MFLCEFTPAKLNKNHQNTYQKNLKYCTLIRFVYCPKKGTIVGLNL